MGTIGNRWNVYDKTVIPTGASLNQRIETKRAFYMGAYTVLDTILKIPEDLEEEEVSSILGGLYDEVTSFIKTIMEDGDADRTGEI